MPPPRSPLAVLALVALALASLTALAPASAEPPLEVAVQRGHQARMTAIAWSPDERLLASADGDRVVILWDVSTGSALRRFEATDHVLGLAFLPGAEATVALGACDGSLVLWDGRTGAVTHTLTPAGQTCIEHLAFSPDGRQLAVGRWNGDVDLWTLDGKTPSSQRIATGGSRSISLAFSPDGRRLAVGGMDTSKQGGHVALVALPRLRVLASWNLPTGVVTNLRFENDAITGFASTCHSFHINPESKIPSISEPSTFSYSVRTLSPDGSLILASQPHQMQLFDLEGHPRLTLGGHGDPDGAVAFTRDQRQVATSGDRQIKIWDLSTGALLRTLGQRRPLVFRAAFTDDGRQLATVDSRQVVIWDLERLAPSRRIAVTDFEPAIARFTPDGTRLLIGGWRSSGGTLLLVDLDTGLIQLDASAHHHGITTLAVDPSGHFAATGTSIGGSLRVWDLDARRTVTDEVQVGEVSDLAFKPGGPLFIATSNHRALAWDWRTEAAPRTILDAPFDTLPTNPPLVFSPDLRFAVMGGTRVTLWDLARNEQRAITPALKPWFTLDLTWSPDSREAWVSWGDDLYAWNVATGRIDHRANDTGRILASTRRGDLIVTTRWPQHVAELRRTDRDARISLVSDVDRWLIFGEDGLFDASPDGASLVALVRGTQVYHIDQLAPTHNRPDLLLERMNLGTAETRIRYREAAERRRARGGEGAASPHALPVVELAPLPAPDASGRVEITAHLTADAGLARAQLWINGVPVPLPNDGALQGSSAELRQRVQLAPGDNAIELAAWDTRGQESLRSLARRTLPADQTAELYVLAFGVSHYQDPSLDLRFADKDARDLAARFERVGGFARVHTRVLTNDEVTTRGIEAAASFLRAARVQDTVVLFVAGHGVQADFGRYYFLTWDTNVDAITTSAAPFERFEQLLRSTPARRRLFLMDTCESGELERGRATRIAANANARGLVARAPRGFELSARATDATLAPSEARERFVYVDLLRRTGAVVFSSSQGGELSYESPRLENGFFTAAVLEALDGRADRDADKQITVEELRAWVTSSVADQTAGLQHPAVDRDNIHADIAFGVAPDDSAPVERTP